MTAPEIAGHLRRLGSKTPRILVLSGGIGTEERTACTAAGIEDVLLKPLDRSRLQEILAASAPSFAAA